MKRLPLALKNHLTTLWKAAVVGATLRVPGMSGGTTAIILKIYDRLLAAVNNFFKDVKQNLLFLGVFALGGGIAFIAFNSLVYKITSAFPAPSTYFFVGIILFGIPALTAEAGISYLTRNKRAPIAPDCGANSGTANLVAAAEEACADKPDHQKSTAKNPSADSLRDSEGLDRASDVSADSTAQSKQSLWATLTSDLIPFLGGAIVIVLISLLQSQGIINADGYGSLGKLIFNLVAGFFAGVALVLPGLSFTYFLTVIGLMDILSQSITLSSVDFVFLASFGVGVVLGLFATAKVLDSFITRHKRGTYLCIIGFLIGSVIMLLSDPAFYPTSSNAFYCVLFFILGAGLITAATHLATRRSSNG